MLVWCLRNSVESKDQEADDRTCGNKVILCACEAAFLLNGAPVLSWWTPLGVPSRMNIGRNYGAPPSQYGSPYSGIHIATPVFIGASSRRPLGHSLKRYGWYWAIAPRRTATGEAVWQPMYQLVSWPAVKLHHIVDDKLHAFSRTHTQQLPNNHSEVKPVWWTTRSSEMEVGRLARLVRQTSSRNMKHQIRRYQQDVWERNMKLLRKKPIPKPRCWDLSRVLVKEFDLFGLDMRVPIEMTRSETSWLGWRIRRRYHPRRWPWKAHKKQPRRLSSLWSWRSWKATKTRKQQKKLLNKNKQFT